MFVFQVVCKQLNVHGKGVWNDWHACKNIMSEMPAPLDGQVHLLKELRPSSLSAMEISSVDGFQGREKEAIIISMVSGCFLPATK